MIEGGSGNDEIWAGSGADVADGGPGDDSFYMLAGDDRASGGPGRDRIDGGADADRLRGGRDRDRIYPGYEGSWGSLLDGAEDRIDCGRSRRDHAIHVERHDETRGCEWVQRLPNGAITTGDLMLNGKATARKRQKQRGEAIVVRVRVKANEYLIVKASGTIDLGVDLQAEGKAALHRGEKDQDAQAKSEEGWRRRGLPGRSSGARGRRRESR